ncbi:MAG TPA: hypothetical protein VK518_13545 [Puia sp.]|nr:hypothetical protein [Puia sp.]
MKYTQLVDKSTKKGYNYAVAKRINELIRNLHICNHRLYFYFEDAGLWIEPAGSITVCDATRIIREYRKGRAPEIPNKVVIPPVTFVIAVLANCYQVLDREFQAHPEQFAAFCQIYAGQNLRPVTPPAETAEQ